MAECYKCMPHWSCNDGEKKCEEVAMYKSPIELIITDIQHQIVKEQDEEIYKAVVNYIPNVDNEELLKALRYDRQQYEKGYADGKRDAMDELVRCKDCKHYVVENEKMLTHCRLYGAVVDDDDFCSGAEGREWQ